MLFFSLKKLDILEPEIDRALQCTDSVSKWQQQLELGRLKQGAGNPFWVSHMGVLEPPPTAESALAGSWFQNCNPGSILIGGAGAASDIFISLPNTPPSVLLVEKQCMNLNAFMVYFKSYSKNTHTTGA